MYQLPSKQSPKYRLPINNHEGPFPLKDITNDNIKSIARLTGSQIIRSNSSYLSSMKSYGNIANLLGKDVKQGLSKIDSIEACHQQANAGVHNIKKQSLSLGTEIYRLRNQMNDLAQKVNRDNAILIDTISPQIKQLQRSIRDHNQIINTQIYTAKKDLEAVNGIKKSFIDKVIGCSRQINRLEIQIGAESTALPEGVYSFQLTQNQIQ